MLLDNFVGKNILFFDRRSDPDDMPILGIGILWILFPMMTWYSSICGLLASTSMITPG